jgi:hypothetical protein
MTTGEWRYRFCGHQVRVMPQDGGRWAAQVGTGFSACAYPTAALAAAGADRYCLKSTAADATRPRPTRCSMTSRE